MPFYLEQRFSMTPGTSGPMYGVGALFYAIAAPLVGYITSKFISKSTAMLIGYLTFILGWVTLYTSITVHVSLAGIYAIMLVSRLVTGAGCAATIAPSMPSMLESIHPEHQCEHSVGIISATWNSCLSLGQGMRCLSIVIAIIGVLMLIFSLRLLILQYWVRFSARQ